ncbi:CHAT domain-containing protein, partial [candidate division KSB1 bacterium]|nr:CHAT domain-containing protein [candidate division KSB1 bacterium]
TCQEMNEKEVLSLALGNLGDVYTESAKYDTALTYLYQSLKLSQELKDRLNEARTMGSIAATYSYMTDYLKASVYSDTAIQIYRELKNIVGESTELGNLGANYLELGNYSKAIFYCNQALSLARQVGDLYLQYMHLDLLGNIYLAMGDYAGAIEYYNQSYKIILEVKDPGAEGKYFLNLASAENELGKFATAAKNFHRALDVATQIGNRRGEGLAAAGLANMYSKLSKYAEAQSWYDRSLQIAREIHNRFSEAKTLNELGMLNLKLGKYPAALTYHQQALKIGDEIASLEIQYETYYVLGQVYEKQDRIPEAIGQYKTAIAIIENIRSGIELEAQKASFFANKIEIYEHLIRLYFMINQQTPDKKYDQTAFYYAEKAKARALLDLLAEAKIDVSQTLDPELQQRQNETYRNISGSLTNLRQEQLTADQRADLNRRLKAAEEQLQALQLEFRQKQPAYANLQTPAPLTLPTVQKEVLQPGELLLEYVLGETQSYLWAVNRNKCQMYALPAENEITTAVKRYLELVSHPPRPGLSLQREGKRLYDLLFKPVTGWISDFQRLIIVPDGVLFYLPFETLVNESSPPKADYLVTMGEINYSPSTSVLHWLRHEQKKPATVPPLELLAFGDPIFGNESASGGTRAQFPENPERGFYDQQGFDLARLPYTATEIGNITQTLPPKSVVTHLRADALEERVKSEDLPRYRRLHFATHGVLDETLPGRSCVVLTLDQDPNEDGFLQVNEIFNLKLNADLVTLSACQTGRGKLLRGEGVLGLTRAFLYAGANSVLVSLWSVNDYSTASLMTQFYQNLAQGKSKIQALRQAKLNFLTDSNLTLRHPYYWAGFVLVGNGSK